MIDEIFEMLMKEARSRPGDSLLSKSCDVLLELVERVVKSCCTERDGYLKSLSKTDKTP